jgi:hypothetical protein
MKSGFILTFSFMTIGMISTLQGRSFVFRNFLERRQPIWAGFVWPRDALAMGLR